MTNIQQNERMNISLLKEVKKAFYKTIPARKRSAFISTLIEDALKSIKRKKIQEDLLYLPSFPTQESSIKTIQSIRKGRNNPEFYVSRV